MMNVFAFHIPGLSLSRSLRTLAIAHCLFPGAGFAAAFDEIDIPAALAGHAEVSMAEGDRTYSGMLAGIDDGRLRVVVRIGGGEVEYPLRIEEIGGVRFPGGELERAARQLYEDGQYEEALPFLDALYRQRVAYLPILDDDQQAMLAALPNAYLETGRLIDAVATGRRLIPDLHKGASRRRLESLVLTGYLEMELFERAAEEARVWCAGREPFGDSALGWWILAEIELEREHFENALWVALQPIVFSGAHTMEHLDRAYAAAAHALYRLEEYDRGLALFLEMKERNLEWPENEDSPRTQTSGAFFREWVEELSARLAVGEDPEMDFRPPETDLNLPLRDIRKLPLALPNE